MAQVLIIQLARVGDVIQTTPLIRALLAQGMEVDMLVYLGHEDLLKGLPIRTVYPLDPEIVRSLNDTLAEDRDPAAGPNSNGLSKGLGLPQYDWVINLANHRCGAWLNQQIQAPRHSGGILKDGDWLYEGDWPSYLFALMETRDQNRFNLVDVWRGLASGDIPGSDAHPFLQQEEVPADWLPAGRLVALNPGANDPRRRWPAASFARVAEGLHKIGAVPILVGSTADREICAAVRAATHLSIPDFSGRTSFAQMAGLLSRVELLISNDTAAMHMGAAVGIPVIGLHGADSFYRETSPWGAGHVVLQAGWPGAPEPMEKLSARIVLSVAMQRLNKATRLHLQNELAAAGAMAWETTILPAGLDPLGGVTYRALHAARPDPGELFSLALRHVIAWDLCGRPEPRPGAAVVSFLAGEGGTLKADALREAAAFSNVVVDFVARLEDVARSIDRVRGSMTPDQRREWTDRSTTAITALFDDAIRQQHGLELLIRHLNWRLKVRPATTPEETLTAYRSEYQRTAEVLSQAMAIWSAVLEAMAEPVTPLA